MSRRKGHAVVEVALMAPWILFLFVGIFDFGFCAYALISVQNAARVAALETSSGSGVSIACGRVLEELRPLPNVGSAASCNCPVGSTVCTINLKNGSATVAASTFTDDDGETGSELTVTYPTVQLIPIPGLVRGRETFTRRAQMRM